MNINIDAVNPTIVIIDSTESEYLQDDLGDALADVSVSCCTCSCSCCC
ncbi:hypothetical protein AAKU55_005443 [Oxalobacteraceae bacterium GrIS 1.11]